MKKYFFCFAKLFIVFLLILLIINPVLTNGKTTKSGTFPSFTSRDLNGNSITDEILKSNNLTLVTYWGTY